MNTNFAIDNQSLTFTSEYVTLDPVVDSQVIKPISSRNYELTVDGQIVNMSSQPNYNFDLAANRITELMEEYGFSTDKEIDAEKFKTEIIDIIWKCIEGEPHHE